MSAHRKRLAARKLEKAVRMILRTDQPGLSGLQNGRLAVDLRHLVSRLRRLAQDDPRNEFWDLLQLAILKVVRYLRHV
jgi:hypothetical protein